MRDLLPYLLLSSPNHVAELRHLLQSLMLWWTKDINSYSSSIFIIHTTQCYENCTKLFNLWRFSLGIMFLFFFLSQLTNEFFIFFYYCPLFSLADFLFTSSVHKKICKLKSKFSFLCLFDFLLSLFVPFYQFLKKKKYPQKNSFLISINHFKNVSIHSQSRDH